MTDPIIDEQVVLDWERDQLFEATVELMRKGAAEGVDPDAMADCLIEGFLEEAARISDRISDAVQREHLRDIRLAAAIAKGPQPGDAARDAA